MTDAEIIKLERIITDSLRSSCTTGDYSRIIDLSECCASITYKDAALFALGVCLNELFVVYEEAQYPSHASRLVENIDKCILMCFQKAIKLRQTHDRVYNVYIEAVNAFNTLNCVRRNGKAPGTIQEIDGKVMKRLEFFSNDPEMVANACKRYFVPAIISEVGFLEEEGKMTEAADLISEKISTLDDLKEKINNDYREPIVNILSTFKVMERKEAKCIIDDVVICYERSIGLLKNRQHATIARTVVDIDNNVKTIINNINEAVNKIDEKYADISKESNTLTELLLTSIRNNEAAHQAVGEFFTKIENQLVDIDSGTASTEDRFKVLEDSLSKSLNNLVPDISQKIIYECNKFFEELKKETASNNGDISRKLQSCHDRIMTYLKTNLGEKLGGQSISERIDKIDVRTDDYLREFTSAVNDNVISDPNNNMAERCKTINKYFQINYKTEWESFNEELTRKSIVTAISLFQMLSENKQLGEMMNYRCVCNPLVVAVEAEMRIRFFEEFKSYYKHNFRDVPDYKRPSVLYYVAGFKDNEKLMNYINDLVPNKYSNFVNKLQQNTLLDLISDKDLKTDIKNISTENNSLRDSLKKCVQRITESCNNMRGEDYRRFPSEMLFYKENKRFTMGDMGKLSSCNEWIGFVQSLEGDITTLLNEAENIREGYRNVTSHADMHNDINEKFTENCIRAILGEIKENHIPVFKDSFMYKLAGVKVRARK